MTVPGNPPVSYALQEQITALRLWISYPIQSFADSVNAITLDSRILIFFGNFHSSTFDAKHLVLSGTHLMLMPALSQLLCF